MPSITVLKSIAILIISFLVGIIVFYLISQDEKEAKKKQIENVISLSINFVIYVWLGKIILKLNIFIKDPLAVLAYPSTSHAIYVATLLIIINMLYRKFRQREQIAPIMYAFIPIFLSASFMYEFLQVVVEKQPYNNMYLYLVTGLTVGYILFYGKVRIHLLSYLFSLSLLIGQLLLTLLNKITIFGYPLLPVYFVVLIVIVTVLIITELRKRKV